MKIRVLCVTAMAILFGLASALLPPEGTSQETGTEQARGMPAAEAPAESGEQAGEQETGAAPAPAAEEVQTILATLSSDPVDFFGPCPAKITFVGTISVTRPCELHYRFIRSDGENSPVKAMRFVTPASREVITNWQVEKDYSGWQMIEILEPQEAESNKAYFTVKCEEAAEVIPPEDVKDEAAVPAGAVDDDDDEADDEDDDADDDSAAARAKPGEMIHGQEKAPPSGEAIQKVESLEGRVAKLEERVAKLEEVKEEAKKTAAPELPVAAAEEPAAAQEPPPPPAQPSRAAAPPPARRVTKLVIRGEPEPGEKEAEEKEAVKEPEEKPRPAYQYYMISGTPLGAEIYEGEVLHGTAPMTLRLSSGKHHFTFTKDGYKDETRELGVSPGGWIEITYNLEPETPPSEPALEQEATPLPDV